MSLFVTPKAIRNQLEKISETSFGGISCQSKMHFVKWATFCKEKNNGDLGIRRMQVSRGRKLPPIIDYCCQVCEIEGVWRSKEIREA